MAWHGPPWAHLSSKLLLPHSLTSQSRLGERSPLAMIVKEGTFMEPDSVY